MRSQELVREKIGEKSLTTQEKNFIMAISGARPDELHAYKDMLFTPTGEEDETMSKLFTAIKEKSIVDIIEILSVHRLDLESYSNHGWDDRDYVANVVISYAFYRGALSYEDVVYYFGHDLDERRTLEPGNIYPSANSFNTRMRLLAEIARSGYHLDDEYLVQWATEGAIKDGSMALPCVLNAIAPILTTDRIDFLLREVAAEFIRGCSYYSSIDGWDKIRLIEILSNTFHQFDENFCVWKYMEVTEAIFGEVCWNGEKEDYENMVCKILWNDIERCSAMCDEMHGVGYTNQYMYLNYIQEIAENNDLDKIAKTCEMLLTRKGDEYEETRNKWVVGSKPVYKWLQKNLTSEVFERLMLILEKLCYNVKLCISQEDTLVEVMELIPDKYVPHIRNWFINYFYPVPERILSIYIHSSSHIILPARNIVEVLEKEIDYVIEHCSWEGVSYYIDKLSYTSYKKITAYILDIDPGVIPDVLYDCFDIYKKLVNYPEATKEDTDKLFDYMLKIVDDYGVLREHNSYTMITGGFEYY